MHFKSSLCLAAAATASAHGVIPPFPSFNFSQAAINSGSALASLNSIALTNALGNLKGKCNSKNVKIRQEWYVLGLDLDKMPVTES